MIIVKEHGSKIEKMKNYIISNINLDEIEKIRLSKLPLLVVKQVALMIRDGCAKEAQEMITAAYYLKLPNISYSIPWLIYKKCPKFTLDVTKILYILANADGSTIVIAKLLKESSNTIDKALRHYRREVLSLYGL